MNKENSNYKCPDCDTVLEFHHETYDRIVYSCPKCNHFIGALKNVPPYEYVDKKENICPYIIDHVNGLDLTGNDLERICEMLNEKQMKINKLKYGPLRELIK